MRKITHSTEVRVCVCVHRLRCGSALHLWTGLSTRWKFCTVLRRRKISGKSAPLAHLPAEARRGAFACRGPPRRTFLWCALSYATIRRCAPYDYALALRALTPPRPSLTGSEPKARPTRGIGPSGRRRNWFCATPLAGAEAPVNPKVDHSEWFEILEDSQSYYRENV